MALIDKYKLTEVRQTGLELLFADEAIMFEDMVCGPLGKRRIATWMDGTVVKTKVTMDLGPVK